MKLHTMRAVSLISLFVLFLSPIRPASATEEQGPPPSEDVSNSELLKRLVALEQEVKDARAETERAKDEIQRLKNAVSAESTASPRIVPATFVDDGAAPEPTAGTHVRSALEGQLSEEGIRALIASMGEPDLSSRIDALEERLESHAEAAATTAQAPVDSSKSALSMESPFGVNIRLTGQIKTEGLVSSRNLGFFQGDLALAAPPTAGINPLNGFPNDQKMTNIDFRESRIGLAMAGPKLHGAETSAYFAIDGYTFGSGVPDGLSTFSVPKNPVSFLFAYADIKWPNLQLHIGQDLTPYGNYFTETINFLQGGGRGSFFGFSPQVRGTYNILSAFSDSQSQRLELIGAVARSTSGLFGLQGPVGQGELSAQPQYHFGARYANDRWGNVPLHIAGYNMAAPLEVEVMGVYAQNDFGRLREDLLGGAGEFRTLSVEVAATVPVIPVRKDGPRRSLSFRGSAYRGENLQQGFQTGAAGIVINKRTGLADEAEGRGFMGQVKYYFTNNLAWVNAYGIDDTDAHAGVLNGFPFFGGLRMTRTYFTTLFYQFPTAPNILLAAQYNNYRDDYQNGDRGSMNFYQTAFYFRF